MTSQQTARADSVGNRVTACAIALEDGEYAQVPMNSGKGRWPFAVLLVSLPTLLCVAGEWTQYRGPNHNATSADRITTNWTGTVTNPLWRVYLSNGVGSITVSGGRVFTQLTRTVDGSFMDVCVALNAATGAELWATPIEPWNYPHTGVGETDDGPRSTPVVQGGSVYVLSSYLKLFRLDASNGAIIWQKDLVELYGAQVIDWQNAASPVLDNDLILLNANAGTERIMAFRTSDGTPAWRAEDEPMTHSTPVIATIHGVRQIIFAGQIHLVSLNPATGQMLWKFRYPFNYATSLAASPVVHQDMVFISGAFVYGQTSVVAQVNFTNGSWTTTQLWAKRDLCSHWMTPIAHNGFLYGQSGLGGFDSPNSQLKCTDMRTGVIRWTANAFGRAATLLVDNRLLITTERGELVLAETNANAYTQIARFLAIPAYHDFYNKIWNCHAVADGRVYVRSTAYLACFDFSVPSLKLEPPQPVSADELSLTIRTANGAPLTSNRIANIALWAESDPAQPFFQWDKLTNEITLSNGVGHVRGIDSRGQPQRFFIASEPEE